MIKSKSCSDIVGVRVCGVAQTSCPPRQSGLGRQTQLNAYVSVTAVSAIASVIPRVIDDIEFYSTSHVTWISAITCQQPHRVASAPSLTDVNATDVTDADATDADANAFDASAYSIAACLATPVEGPEKIVRLGNVANGANGANGANENANGANGANANANANEKSIDKMDHSTYGYSSLTRWSEWVRRLRRRKVKEFFAMIGYNVNILDPFGNGTPQKRDRVYTMSSVDLIAEAIDVGRETLQNDAGYGIVAVIEGGIVRQ
jgi:hypothetical protein